jgi:hypothetical protein
VSGSTYEVISRGYAAGRRTDQRIAGPALGRPRRSAHRGQYRGGHRLLRAVRPQTSPLDALGIEDAAWFGCSDYKYVIQVDIPGQVKDAQPDRVRILGFPVSRVILTAPGGTGADFTSRVFVPAIGLDEDQVTGAAHAVLGPLWAVRLGRDNLTAVQASARRASLPSRLGAIAFGSAGMP